MTTIARAALVTGAASGVGAAVARRLAAPGTALLLTTRRNGDALARVAAAARDAGAIVATALGDLATADTAPLLVSQAMREFGRIDVLISNAGFADRTAATALDDATLDASFQSIAGAFLRLVRAAAPVMTKSGRIVATGSFVSHAFRLGVPIFAASAAAKAAQEALVRALAMELAPRGITVNAVVPGFVRKDAGAAAALGPVESAGRTSAIPLGRLGLPEDIAAAIAFLASFDAGYITGQALHVDGGLVIHG